MEILLTLMAKLYGDWNFGTRLKLYAAHRKNSFSQQMAEEVEKLARKYVKIVKRNIRDQKLSLAPLSDHTVKIKSAHNEDWWIETGEFSKKLKVEWVGGNPSKTRGTIYAGATEDTIHTGSGLTMAKLAKYLEYGTYKIPGRPLFQMSYDELWERDVKQMEKNMAINIQKIFG
jgi:hypothetical protein